jgi:hypothetical protein
MSRGNTPFPLCVHCKYYAAPGESYTRSPEECVCPQNLSLVNGKTPLKTPHRLRHEMSDHLACGTTGRWWEDKDQGPA